MFLEKISLTEEASHHIKRHVHHPALDGKKEEKFRLFNVRTTKHPLIHHRHIPYLSPAKSLHIY